MTELHSDRRREERIEKLKKEYISGYLAKTSLQKLLSSEDAMQKLMQDLIDYEESLQDPSFQVGDVVRFTEFSKNEGLEATVIRVTDDSIVLHSRGNPMDCEKNQKSYTAYIYTDQAQKIELVSRFNESMSADQKHS